MPRLTLLLGLNCLFYVLLDPKVWAYEPPSSDQQLLAEIEKQLHQAGRGSEANVSVRVTGGVANLSGDVTSYADRMLLERFCRRVDGITAVENRLRVLPPLVTDEALVGTVKERMKADALLHHQHIEITAQSGVVSLSGKVPTWTDRRRATAAARQVQGVRDVRNNITVSTSNSDAGPRATTPDIIIEAQLRKLLSGQSPLAELELKYRLNRGEVTLEGQLPSWQQKSFLRDLMQAIPGVVKVDMRKVRVADQGVSAIDFVDENTAAGRKAVIQLVIDAAMVDPDHKVSVQLQDEELILEGEVDSLAQQHRLLQLAKAFGGAFNIGNRLSIIPTPRDDGAIERELQAIMAKDAILNKADLRIKVQGGRATLTGRVPDFNTKARAIRIATRIAGLVAIDNRVTVEWSACVSDDGLKKIIEKKVQEAHGEQAKAIDVTVDEGVVTITGTLSDGELEQSIVELIQSVDCVRTVRSEVMVVPLPAEIASQ